jgi:hypothetical protein
MFGGRMRRLYPQLVVPSVPTVTSAEPSYPSYPNLFMRRVFSEQMGSFLPGNLSSSLPTLSSKLSQLVAIHHPYLMGNTFSCTLSLSLCLSLSYVYMSSSSHLLWLTRIYVVLSTCRILIDRLKRTVSCQFGCQI